MVLAKEEEVRLCKTWRFHPQTQPSLLIQVLWLHERAVTPCLTHMHTHQVITLFSRKTCKKRKCLMNTYEYLKESFHQLPHVGSTLFPICPKSGSLCQGRQTLLVS